MTPPPQDVTRDQTFLAAICARLDAQNELLADIRDRLPAPARGQPATPGAGRQVVELREPVTASAVGDAPNVAKSVAGLPQEPAPSRLAKAARATTKKTTARHTARTKENT